MTYTLEVFVNEHRCSTILDTMPQAQETYQETLYFKQDSMVSLVFHFSATIPEAVQQWLREKHTCGEVDAATAYDSYSARSEVPEGAPLSAAFTECPFALLSPGNSEPSFSLTPDGNALLIN